MAEIKYLTPDIDSLAVLANYYDWILDEIRPFLGRRMAEIGAGIGTFTERLAAARLDSDPTAVLQAFEPAANLFQQLHAKLEPDRRSLLRSGRLVLHHGYFQTAGDAFDSIIMINVLEHVEDDAALLRMIYNSLSDRGTFIAFVPALPWLFSAHDKMVGHYRRYDKASLEGLLSAEGFHILKCKYFDCLGILPWYLLNVLFGAHATMNPRLSWFYDKVFVPLSRRIEYRCPPSLGKNLLIVGGKGSIPS